MDISTGNPKTTEHVTERPQIIIDDSVNIRINRRCCYTLFNSLMCYFCYSRINVLDSSFDSDNDD